ncbi:MAG: DUF1028 domain-containing protein [Devosia sp.]
MSSRQTAALISTYSIVLRCSATGEVGAGVASAVPAVGAICLYTRPGVGAVSTQSWVNPYLAGTILDHLEAGVTAADAVAKAVDRDAAAALRQLGAIGTTGPGAAFTGADCTPWCGALEGADFAVQGNMLTGPEVLDAMAQAAASAGPLEERLLVALEAAQRVGGDKRGRQSAGIAVIGAEDYRRVDLRVDEHPDPVAELRRVYTVAAAQLAPFIAGMPKKGQVAEGAPDGVVAMLLAPPPDRPEGGGSRTP